MPLIDLPLPELLKYKGRNPRPSDHDAYWDAGLAEMYAVDPQVELTRTKELAAPSAEFFDLWFTGVGGARIHAKYVRPKRVESPIPAILEFHGYAGSSGDWSSKLGWVGQGCAIASLDCRGQGGKSDDLTSVRGTTHHGHIIRGLDDPDPRKLLFRNIFLDTAQLARIVAGFGEIDETRIGAAGGSQGGALALACAALAPQIKKVACLYPFLCDYKRVWEMDQATNAYAEMKTYFRQFDPRHEREEEIFTKLGYVDIQHLAARINAEVLMGVGLMDNICPPSTQFAAFNKIRGPKQYVIYPDFGHEGLPGYGDISFRFLSTLLRCLA